MTVQHPAHRQTVDDWYNPRKKRRDQLVALDYRLAALEDAMVDSMSNVVWEVMETDSVVPVLDELFFAAKLLRYQQLLVDVMDSFDEMGAFVPRPMVDVPTGGAL